VNAHQIYQAADPALITDLFTWLRNEEKDLYKNTVTSLAQDRKLRPVFIQKKSLPDQYKWLHKTLKLKSTDMMGEHLFQLFFMKGNEELLVTFCDAMGIEHDGKGSVEGELPKELDAAKAKGAVDALLAKFDPNLVTAYLYVFNLQTEGGWDSITALLESDDRLKLA
jgi:hypothetical protein|tara:strand:- start:2032 stop:2532 length:501 start_codon:yes stop_codon:yes gene_type:complete